MTKIVKLDNPAVGIANGACISHEITDESEHFMKCPDCGQYFDMRDLGQVFHHAELGHEPITPDS